MPESWIENYIKAFVLEKTAEKVYLDLKSSIYVRPVTKKGSILLATFWANVLQHADNFPVECNAYSKRYETENLSDTLTLTVDNMKLKIYMAKGTLKISGLFVYEWFMKHFSLILDRFDPGFINRYKYHDPLKPMPPQANSDTTAYELTDIERYLLAPPTKTLIDAALDCKIKFQSEGLVAGLEQLSPDQALIEGDELVAETEAVSSGTIVDGYACGYKLWKSLLLQWMKDEGTKVFIVTPHLDQERLKNIFDIALISQYKGKLEALYTGSIAADGRMITQLVNSTMSCVEYREQAILEYSVIQKMLIPADPFEVSFIAGVKDGEASVFILGGDSNTTSFTAGVNLFVMYSKMKEDEFLGKYVKPVSTASLLRR